MNVKYADSSDFVDLLFIAKLSVDPFMILFVHWVARSPSDNGC